MTLAVAAAAASSSAKNSRCSSRGSSNQHFCRQGRHELVEDTVNLRALRVFASYLPAGLVLRYAASADPSPPVQPEREDFEAVVCFLDVSGFTALSEKLQKEHGQAKDRPEIDSYLRYQSIYLSIYDLSIHLPGRPVPSCLTSTSTRTSSGSSSG